LERGWEELGALSEGWVWGKNSFIFRKEEPKILFTKLYLFPFWVRGKKRIPWVIFLDEFLGKI